MTKIKDLLGAAEAAPLQNDFEIEFFSNLLEPRHCLSPGTDGSPPWMSSIGARSRMPATFSRRPNTTADSDSDQLVSSRGNGMAFLGSILG
jgi:hypothetical protein